MVKVIQDFWILTENGTILFSRVFQKDLDDNLFAAMMSALNSFAQELSDGGLSSFQLSNKNFSIIKNQNCLFIASYLKKSKEKKVLHELKIIADRFITLFSDEIANFGGEVSLFSKFEEEIEDSLDQVVDKLQKGFW